MLTLDDIRAMALALGFARVVATDASPTDAPPPNAHPQALSLATDPRTVLPEAQSVLLLVMPYTPYRARPGEAEVDAYYIASNTAHENARRLAEEIAATGAKAVMTSSLRTKPLAVRAGLGRVGRNGLVAIGEWGTRASLQVIVTDLPLPESMRPMTGRSVLGCDICQRCCPRNARVGEAEAPPALSEALALHRLLGGDYKGLVPWLGKNNARRLRLLNRAALAAANEGRRDLLPRIEALRLEPDPLGEHAAWSANRLKSREEAQQERKSPDGASG